METNPEGRLCHDEPGATHPSFELFNSLLVEMATMSFLWNVPCLALPSNVITCASAANAALRTRRRNASGSGMEHTSKP